MINWWNFRKNLNVRANPSYTSNWVSKSEVMILTFMIWGTFIVFWSQEVIECADLIIKLRYPFRFFWSEDDLQVLGHLKKWLQKPPNINKIKIENLRIFSNSRELDDIWEYLTMRPSNNRKNELNKSSTLQILENACWGSHAGVTWIYRILWFLKNLPSSNFSKLKFCLSRFLWVSKLSSGAVISRHPSEIYKV